MSNKIQGKFNLNIQKIAIAALLLISSESFAQDAFKPSVYAGSEFGLIDIANRNRLFKNYSFIDSYNGPNEVMSARVFLGYKISENFDAELGLSQTGEINYVVSGENDGVQYTNSFNHVIRRFDSSILMRPSIASGFNGLYFRLGLLVDINSRNFKVVQNGSTNYGSDLDSNLGVLTGVGYDFNIANNFDARFEIAKSLGGSFLLPHDTKFSLGFVIKF